MHGMYFYLNTEIHQVGSFLEVRFVSILAFTTIVCMKV